MKKFSVAVIVWIILLLGGAGTKLFQLHCYARPALDWLASQALPENHQIRIDDLKKPANVIADDQLPLADNLIGRHLLRDQNENAPIAIQDLSLMPTVAAIGDDYIAFVYNLDAGELVTADLLEIGSRVRLCAAQPVATSTPGGSEQKAADAACLIVPVQVLAIHRKTSAAPEDWLLLKVSLQDANEFVKLLAAKPRFLLITSKHR